LRIFSSRNIGGIPSGDVQKSIIFNNISGVGNLSGVVDSVATVDARFANFSDFPVVIIFRALAIAVGICAENDFSILRLIIIINEGVLGAVAFMIMSTGRPSRCRIASEEFGAIGSANTMSHDGVILVIDNCNRAHRVYCVVSESLNAAGVSDLSRSRNSYNEVIVISFKAAIVSGSGSNHTVSVDVEAELTFAVSDDVEIVREISHDGSQSYLGFIGNICSIKSDSVDSAASIRSNWSGNGHND